MKHLSDRFTAVLDANVLYPALVRDVLLSLAYAGLYRARWTAKITEEWSEHLIGRFPGKRVKIKATVRCMNEEFPEAIVECYEPLVDALDLPDPNDRHVLAAAVKDGAHLIVTENLREFPPEILVPLDIEARTADDFIVNTIQLHEAEAVAAIRDMRAKYEAPPVSANELISRLVKAGLVTTAAELKPHIDVI